MPSLRSLLLALAPCVLLPLLLASPLRAAPPSPPSADTPLDEDQDGGRWVQWRGGVGLWSEADRWSDLEVPGQSGPDAVQIGTGGHGFSVVALDVDAAVDRLRLDARQRLLIGPGRTLHVLPAGFTTSLTIDGELRLSPGDNQAPATLALHGDSDVELHGSGRIALESAAFAAIAAPDGGSRLWINGPHITGSGAIGQGAIEIVNDSVVQADQEYQPLTLRPDQRGITNRGVLRATGLGWLVLDGGDIHNHSGMIEAYQDSRIDLQNVRVVGGTLRSFGTGAIRTVYADASLADLTLLQGVYEMTGGQLTLSGQISNHGAIYLTSSDDRSGGGGGDSVTPAQLRLDFSRGDVRLEGSGHAVLTDLEAQALPGSGSGWLINGPQHHISASGMLGMDTFSLRNEGVIEAVGDVPLLLDPHDSQPIVNLGRMIASNTGGILLISGTITNDGTIEIRSGSEFYALPGTTVTNLVGTALSGGVWKVDGRTDLARLRFSGTPGIDTNLAEIELLGPQADVPKLSDLSYNGGTLRVGADHHLMLPGPLTNVGTIEVDASSSVSAAGGFILTPQSRLIYRLGSAENVAQGDGPVPLRGGPGGGVALDGVLELTLPPDVDWTPGASFTIAVGDPIVGTFDEIIAPGPVSIEVQNDSLVITVLGGACPADLTGDLQVNVHDLLGLLSAWGVCEAGGSCPADLTRDEVVNVFDLTALLGAWGECGG